MKTYFLTAQDLESLVFFSSISLYESFGKNNKYLEQWDKQFFNEILKNQPELKNSVEDFKAEISALKTLLPKKELFSHFFKDKIDIQSVKELIFDHSINEDNKLRGDFYKRIYKAYPQFLDMMDEEIKKGTGNKSFLYESYFQIMKSKDTDKSKYTNEGILQNIKK